MDFARGDRVNFLNVQSSSGADTASCSMDNSGFFSGVKWSKREVDHSFNLMPRLWMFCSYTFTPSILVISVHEFGIRLRKINGESFRFLWPCIVSNVWRERKKPTRCNNQMSIINMFRASLCPSSGEQRPCVTAYGVLRWFCWMWLVAVVGRCVVGCEHCSHPTTQCPTTTSSRTRAVHYMQ